MCMYVRTEGPVPQRALRNRKERPARNVQKHNEGTGRKPGAVTALKDDAFDFLNVKYEDVAVTEEYFAGCFGLNLRESYDRLLTVSAKFLEYFGKPFDFKPNEADDLTVRFDALTEWFGKHVSDLGFQLATVKRDPHDMECGDIDFVVFNPCYELELKVCVFIVSPVETLPKKAAYLYAQYMKFLSDSMCIGMGIEHSDNYYLSMVSDMFDDPEQDVEELDGEDKEMLQKRRKLMKDYKTGRYKKIFDEIDSLKPYRLVQSIESYVKECKDGDIIHLFDVLLEGFPLVAKMNVHWFDFNPEEDGIEESQDSFIEVFSQNAILYSFNDGIEDQLIEYLENDYNCGVIPVGWNQRLRLYDGITEDDIREFVDNRNLAFEFSQWIGNYYYAVRKFDAIQEEENE